MVRCKEPGIFASALWPSRNSIARRMGQAGSCRHSAFQIMWLHRFALGKRQYFVAYCLVPIIGMLRRKNSWNFTSEICPKQNLTPSSTLQVNLCRRP
jgi:hypothetical protein